ncbi:hypothetical protein EVG20_g8216 [Dentipellis fragilis]|uniref:Uncharacterized protein n=1 Tax=Dentipellis fragilis TaxID=205917 RepID=A0A4Y9Y7X6_9AGAM|nr:hypothetical protein EVG20_g8216 [Dentipellis fragilis]
MVSSDGQFFGPRTALTKPGNHSPWLSPLSTDVVSEHAWPAINGGVCCAPPPPLSINLPNRQASRLPNRTRYPRPDYRPMRRAEGTYLTPPLLHPGPKRPQIRPAPATARRSLSSDLLSFAAPIPPASPYRLLRRCRSARARSALGPAREHACLSGLFEHAQMQLPAQMQPNVPACMFGVCMYASLSTLHIRSIAPQVGVGAHLPLFYGNFSLGRTGPYSRYPPAGRHGADPFSSFQRVRGMASRRRHVRPRACLLYLQRPVP